MSVDAWGGSWLTAWLLHWTYVPSTQPATSGGHGGAGHRRRHDGRFFSYPNVIDDGNLDFLEPSRKVIQRKKKPKPQPDTPIDENDPDIQRMRRALEKRLLQPQQPAQPERDPVMDLAQQMIKRRLTPKQ